MVCDEWCVVSGDGVTRMDVSSLQNTSYPMSPIANRTQHHEEIFSSNHYLPVLDWLTYVRSHPYHVLKGLGK